MPDRARTDRRPFVHAGQVLALLMVMPSADAAALPACLGTLSEPVTVERVSPRLTLDLADGRTVRLADVEPSDGPRETRGLAADLAALTGRTVRLAPLDGPTDRWGRRVANVVVTVTGEWLQQSLVRRGLVFVGPTVMSGRCVRELIAAEDQARADGAGVWRQGGPRSAADGGPEPGRTGAFGYFEGRVESVGETRRSFYLNFGRHWSTDATVIVAEEDRRRWPAVDSDLRRLIGRRVRVRGLVESWHGPLIRVEHPAQIELLGD